MTDALALEPEHLDILRSLLAKHLPPGTRVWAYGSRATGKRLRRGSDLDLMVQADGPLDLGLLGMLADDLSESLLPYVVDLHDWHRTGTGFIARIQPDMVRLAVLAD